MDSGSTLYGKFCCRLFPGHFMMCSVLRQCALGSSSGVPLEKLPKMLSEKYNRQSPWDGRLRINNSKSNIFDIFGLRDFYTCAHFLNFFGRVIEPVNLLPELTQL
jgi:hypothetical protein